MAGAFHLGAQDFAHRGLWSSGGPPENSLGALAAAAEAGFGAELDVRLSRDGVAMVFHDALLERMTPGQGALSLHASASLARLPLAGSGETIPTLAQVLDAWPDGLALLIELKADGLPDPAALAHAVAELLEGWPGPAAVMSFSPAALDAFPTALHPRGLLIAPPGLGASDSLADRLDHSGANRFDFLGLHTSRLPEAAALGTGAGKIGREIVAWTVDTPEKLALARAQADAAIFEHLDSGLVKSARDT